MTLNLIETFKTSIYNPEHTKKTRKYMIKITNKSKRKWTKNRNDQRFMWICTAFCITYIFYILSSFQRSSIIVIALFNGVAYVEAALAQMERAVTSTAKERSNVMATCDTLCLESDGSWISNSQRVDMKTRQENDNIGIPKSEHIAPRHLKYYRLSTI